MARRDENIELEMSDCSAAESKNEDSNASDYEMSSYNKQQTANTSKTNEKSYAKPSKSLRSTWNIESTIATATLCNNRQDSFKVIDRSKTRCA